MKLFLQFLKQRRLCLAVGGGCCCLFLAAFALYHLPVQAVLYPLALCVLVVAAALAADFLAMRRRHKSFGRLLRMAEPEPQSLPKPNSVESADYLQLLEKVTAELKAYRGQKEAETAQAVDYYTTWMHQIKTPISSMRLHLQNEDSALSRALSSDLLHIEQYVEMALTYLRLGFEQTDYLFSEYDLAEITARAIKHFRGEFIHRHLSLNYLPVKTTVLTDEKWLQFVIEQLLSNALKYTPAGSITVLVQPQRLTITDTGIGIAPQDLPRIFESGFTGFNGRVNQRASGIGLYLCKRICNRLGHEITVRSTLDEGTTVELNLRRPQLEVE